MLTIPEGVVDDDSDPLAAPPVDKLPAADFVPAAIIIDSDALIDDCAEARPIRAATTVDLEKSILIVVKLIGPERVL
jgi:hypothetical protein